MPVVAPVCTLAAWLAAQAGATATTGGRLVRSTGSAPRLSPALAGGVATSAGRARWIASSGPGGGLAPDEEVAAVARGFTCVSRGQWVLRADIAPLAWLAQMTVLPAP